MADELDGAVDTQDADGRVEGTEEGGEVKSYAGFQTPDELAEAYAAKEAREKTLSDEVEQLKQLKGRMGNDIGQLRMQMAKQQGMLQAMQEAKAQSTAQGISTDTIYQQLANGDIDESQALRAMETALSTKYEGRLNDFQNQFKTFQDQMESEKYVQNFIAQNPGYKEAYESGALNKWLYNNVPGETAWSEYKREQAEARAAELEKKIEAAKLEAEKAGIQKGTQLQQGKQSAGKVLGDQPSGGRVQVTPPSFANKSQRARAGYEYIQKLRAARQ